MSGSKAFRSIITPMADQALYRKWRPAAFDEVVGQEHVINTIRNALASGRAAHAYLFSGPRGTGKTSTARLVAKALNCTHPDPHQRPDNTCPNCLAVNEGRFLDLIEIDAASNTGVDNIRDLRDKINFAPGEGRCKIYIIDEVHMLSMGAFNALLKTLEEPPAHAIFILATTELHKVPLTVASRCQKHAFRRIPAAEVARRLQEIVEREALTVEPSVLELVARQATGSLRDAISLLDQLVIAPDEPVTLDSALAVMGTASGQAVQDLADALAEHDTARGLDLINAATDGGADPRQFARQMVDYLRGLLLIRLGNPALVDAYAGIETRKAMQLQAAKFEPAALLRAIKAFNTASDQRGAWISQLPLELAFVESLRAPAPADPPVAASHLAPAQPVRAASIPKHPTTPAAPTPTPASPTVQLGTIVSKWKEVAAASRRIHPSLQALVNSCKPFSLEGDVLTLAFDHETPRSKAETESNRQGIEKALRGVIGSPLKVRCIMGAGGDSLPDVDGNGVVAEAMRLGGKVRKQ
ncbi:MAG: DNA polymerase III subunit gamma/tau [Chloroflexi bacterium]|nr:DNA polymerase III subunit gamma/tau [Chloroflexota bacterium]